MPDYQFCVSLSITHPTVNPNEITGILDIKPSKIQTVGEPRISYKGESLEGLNKESFWRADLHQEKRLHSNDIYLEDFLAKQNEKIKIHKEYLNSLVESGGYIEYFIGWFSEGTINMSATFTPDLLQSTADLNISIGLDVYPD